MIECYYCDGDHGILAECPVALGDKPYREWQCACGSTVELYYWERASDTNCEQCGQMFNCWGQRVNGSLQSIDFADAGERWDDD